MKFLGFVVLFAGAAACSGASAAPEQIPTNRTITQVRTYNWGAAIHFTPAFTNAQGCASPVADSAVVIDYDTNPNMKPLFAAALAAHLAGKTVGFGIDGCHTGYGGGTPKTYRVDVNP